MQEVSMGNTRVITTPQAATYGSSMRYGKYGTGPGAASDEAFDRANENNADQNAVQGAMGYANGQAQTQRGPQAVQDPTAANNQASGADGNQAGAIELARRMAMGQAPSPAAMQLQTGLNQATHQQGAMAAGARGSAALATAGSNMAANTANLQQNAYTAGGMLRSQDMANGRGLYGSLLGDSRSQDANALGMSDQFGVENQNRNDQYALGMGNAAVGLGGTSNGQNAEDANNFNRGMQPIYDQDEANQQHQLWYADARQQAAAANKDN